MVGFPPSDVMDDGKYFKVFNENLTVSTALVVKEQNVTVNVVGQKIQKVNKWIWIRIETNKMIQKQIMDKIQQPNRNDAGETRRIYYIHSTY